MHCKKDTVIRSVVLAIALLNQILIAIGKNPLPFSDEALYEAFSSVLTVGASLWAWWKNNSFTSKAVEADRYLAAIRAISLGEEEDD